MRFGRFSFWRMAVACSAPLALAGCISLGGGAPPDKLYTLTSDSLVAPGAQATSAHGRPVVVGIPEVPRALAVTRVAVEASPVSVAYLKGANWVERPAALFRNLIAEKLAATSAGLVVNEGVPPPPEAVGLSGELLALDYDAGAHGVVVRYQALLRAPDGSIESRRFEEREAGVEPTPEAVTSALNRVANTVAGQVAAWVAHPGIAGDHN